ncbi:polyisoprenoid-binding protein YceI [Staphylococcus schleiferi]|uniref:YceI-like domain-containing protein n=1 Tax=Staphylococcus schleiferi TaxID=1295 RepID=A0A7Z7VY62_STASC|nr:YceI-like domain-containing protein [Staphylococcus schleiferi]SUM90490.1 YceI-like domain-containing protein [Staphylococcus schleiferi]
MTKFNLDTVHSTFGFSIKHLMVSKIRGTFKDYDIQLTGDVGDASSLSAVATIKVDSVDTGNADRDQH